MIGIKTNKIECKQTFLTRISFEIVNQQIMRIVILYVQHTFCLYLMSNVQIIYKKISLTSQKKAVFFGTAFFEIRSTYC